MIVLDSDIFTLLTYGNAKVREHYDAVPGDEELAVTVVTRMEVLRGRTDNLLKAADEQQLLQAAKRLRETEEALGDFLVVGVDRAAAAHFTSLRRQKKLNKLRRADMLIACIVLAHNALLVSRNTKDFNKVPGLNLANWADD